MTLVPLVETRMLTGDHASIAEAVGAAGISDEELTDFFAGAVRGVRAEKRDPHPV